MALSARELLLVLRGQNDMSSAVRRAAADVGTLKDATAKQRLAAVSGQLANNAGDRQRVALLKQQEVAYSRLQRQQSAMLDMERKMMLATTEQREEMAQLQKFAREQEPGTIVLIPQEQAKALGLWTSRMSDAVTKTGRLRVESTVLDAAIEKNTLSWKAAQGQLMSTMYAVEALDLAEKKLILDNEKLALSAKVAAEAQEQQGRSFVDSALGASAFGFLAGRNRTFGLGGFGRFGIGLLAGTLLPHFAFGSVGQLLGFGAERMVGTTLGLGGTVVGGLLGGGLLASGILGTSLVGMGTNLAGIGQAAGDIKNVTQAMNALTVAQNTYGKSSQQAVQAQQQLNQTLGSFSPVARAAVVQAAKTSISLKTLFDQVTGGAEKTGAQIINQALLTGKSYIPTIGTYAAENMSIIKQKLQPLFSWLKNSSFSGPGFGGGLGIFTNLEQIFQKNLPYSVQAGSKAFEFLIRTVDVAAQRTGGIMQRIDAFFTKMNRAGPFGKWAKDVNTLINMFDNLVHLVGAFGHDIVDLSKPLVGAGTAIVKGLTVALNQIGSWINQSGTQNVLNKLFSAHLTQMVQGFGAAIKAILPFIENFVSAVLQLEAAAAPLVTVVLKQLADLLNAINRNPFAAKIIGWAVAIGTYTFAIGKLLVALRLLQTFTLGGVLKGALGVGGAGAATGAEAGSIGIGAALTLGIPAAIAALIIFHKQVTQVVTALGGLHNTLAVVASAVAAFIIVTKGFAAVGIASDALAAASGIRAIIPAAVAATTSVLTLRTALLGIAGLAVAATVLIVERKQVRSAIQNAFGDTLQKEINAFTGMPNKLSTGQQIGTWLTSSWKNFFSGWTSKSGWSAGWNEAIHQASTGMEKVSIGYRAFLQDIGKPGSPQALNEFVLMMHRAGIAPRSATQDWASFLNTLRQSSYGLSGIRNLHTQLQAIIKQQFELAHQNPFGDINNRAVEAAAAIQRMKQAAIEAKNAFKGMLQQAFQMGVVATPQFQKLYSAAIKAKEAFKLHPDVSTERQAVEAAKLLNQYMASASDPVHRTTTAVKQLTQAYIQAAKAAALDPTSMQKQLAAQQALTNLQKGASQQQVQAAQAVAQAEISALQKTTQFGTQTQETFQNVLNSVQGMFNTMQSNEQTLFGTLFNGPYMQSPFVQNFLAWGGIPSGKMLFKDLQSQLNAFRQFHAALDNLRKRGAPEALIQQLEALGPQALQEIQNLTKLSGPELHKYFAMFGKAQTDINKQALRDLHQQLAAYKKFGKDIALAIVSGLQDQNTAITNALRKMIRQMFPGLPGRGAARYATARNPGTVRTPRVHAGSTTHTGSTHKARARHYYRSRAPSPPLHKHGATGTAAYHPATRVRPIFVDYVRSPQFPLSVPATTQAVSNAIEQKRHVFHHSITRDLKAAEPVRVMIMNWPHHPHKEHQGKMEHHDHYHVEAPAGSSIDTQIKHAAFKNRAKHKGKPLSGDRYTI